MIGSLLGLLGEKEAPGNGRSARSVSQTTGQMVPSLRRRRCPAHDQLHAGGTHASTRADNRC